MKIFGFEINKTNNIQPIVNVAPAAKEKDIFRYTVQHQQQLNRTRQDIATWRNALASAESIQFPNRTELYRLYQDIMLDAHLSSLIETRKNAILAANFIVTKKGKEKDEKTEYISKKWFYDFTNLALDSIFYGYSLIQFEYDNSLDEFINLELVPRQYVKPEFNIVVSNPAMNTGTSYLEAPFNEWVIGVGDKRNLGLLAKAAPLVLWKKGAIVAWSEYSERFGNPILVGKTPARDEATRANLEGFLRDLGTSASGVMDIDDVIEIIETKKTSAYDIFDMLIERCNSELSKLILGQTSTSDQKAYVGAANVHERILHQVNEADQIFLENIYKYQLVPFLNGHGAGFNGMCIEAEADDELNLEQKSKIDIELLKTGLYTIDPEYILETYGTPVVAVTPSTGKTDTSITEVKNRLSDYYGNPEL